MQSKNAFPNKAAKEMQKCSKNLYRKFWNILNFFFMSKNKELEELY